MGEGEQLGAVQADSEFKARLLVNAMLHGLSTHEAFVVGAMIETFPDQPDWDTFERRSKIKRQNLRRVRAGLASKGLIVAEKVEGKDRYSYRLNADIQPPKDVLNLASRLSKVITKDDSDHSEVIGPDDNGRNGVIGRDDIPNGRSHQKRKSDDLPSHQKFNSDDIEVIKNSQTMTSGPRSLVGDRAGATGRELDCLDLPGDPRQSKTGGNARGGDPYAPGDDSEIEEGFREPGMTAIQRIELPAYLAEAFKGSVDEEVSRVRAKELLGISKINMAPWRYWEAAVALVAWKVKDGQKVGSVVGFICERIHRYASRGEIDSEALALVRPKPTKAPAAPFRVISDEEERAAASERLKRAAKALEEAKTRPRPDRVPPARSGSFLRRAR